MKIELQNDFHNTSVFLNVSDLKLSNELGYGTEKDYDYVCKITATQMRRASRKLCGFTDCTCGKVRGTQRHNGRNLIVRCD